ncbi:hypothetical protein HNQ08_002818 [Deinococcus humi]|uniref:Uncharacterized protein n=1 Tax=Deinococcus humi TaxID=662880 RepID=A0A7W8JUX4_9DEIO|nr:hypothetical protein [Deinococcus humi]
MRSRLLIHVLVRLNHAALGHLSKGGCLGHPADVISRFCA